MNKHNAAQDPVVLLLGATAEPKTCGSCCRFERAEPWNGAPGGWCLLRLPPHYAQKINDPDGKPWNVVRDTHGCDLHKHTGKAYIVSMLVHP